MWFGLSQDVHLAQFCPTDERTYYRLVASAMSGLCRKLRNGDPVADKPSVTGCVKSAIDDSVVVGRTATCFPVRGGAQPAAHRFRPAVCPLVAARMRVATLAPSVLPLNARQL